MVKGRSQTRRLKLFELGARAVALYVQADEDLYVCPICCRAFTSAAAMDGTLSLEHVPPKSAGGNELVLTCRQCNSKAGESIDSAEARRREMDATLGAAIGKLDVARPRAAHLTVEGSTIPVQISRSNGITKLRQVPKASHPAIRRRVMEILKRPRRSEEKELTLRVSRKDFHWLSMISDLKTGFLAAFALLGYGFACHPNLASVRRQICEPSNPVLGTRFHLSFSAETFGTPMLVAVAYPLPCIAAILEKRAVLMPEPCGPDTLYESLDTLGNLDMKIRGHRLRWPTLMELKLDQSRDRS